MEIHTPVPVYGFLLLDVQVVRAHVPLLVRLDVLRAFRLTFNFMANCMTSSDHPWSLSPKFSVGHSFISPSALFPTFVVSIRGTDAL